MSESAEAYQRRLSRQREINRRLRANETPDKRAHRLAVQRAWDRKRRETETDDERNRRLESDRQSHRRMSERMTDDERKAFYEKRKARNAAAAASETAEQREIRLSRQRIYTAKSRQRRSDEQKRRDAAANRMYRNANHATLSMKKRQRYASSQAIRVKSLLRGRTRRAISSAGGKKQSTTMKLTGIDSDGLVRWLEGQFVDGMSWENHGEWHVDHIIPCAAFDLTDADQQRVCFHYTNLRPLWGAENLVKRDSLPIQRERRWTLASIGRARAALGLTAMHVAGVEP